MAKNNPLSGLSDVEYAIMHILWTAETPLSANDIYSIAQENGSCTWDKRTTFLTINKLSKKNLVTMSGITRRNKAYPRMFSASVTKAEYMANKVYHVLTPPERKEFKVKLNEKEAGGGS